LGHGALVLEGAAAGFTGGHGGYLNKFGGPAEVAASAKATGVTADQELEAHSALVSIETNTANQDHMEALLDALQLKAREDTDLSFRSDFNIRTWLKNGVRPS